MKISNWRDLAVCRDAEPERFAPIEQWDHNNTLAEARRVADQYCNRCPALLWCGQFADDNRYQGVYGGILRTGATNKYTRHPLIDGLTMPPLADRRTGVRSGWAS